ncbi:MAG: S1 RNA-binding domain-containing protein, partial [Pseudomonadota bacterium]|nr:S1 RNA-binding domain-containing protein [Pseudomonadota bacterium]
EYMQDRVGDEFNGTITSVASFGLFIELNDYYVEGLVHITELSNDYYHFDPVRHLLQGERSGLTYQLGDSVTVRLVRVDLEEKKIDLQMVGSRKSRPSNGKLRQSLKAGKVGTKPKTKIKTKTKTKNNQGKQRTTRSKKSADKRSESGKSARTTSEKPAKSAKKIKTKKQIASATARKKGATRGAAKRQAGDSQRGKTVGRKAAS